ncbi:MAG: tryptophan synthase subunit alpha [Actinomycetota bacterium]
MIDTGAARLEALFADVRRERRAALLPYLTAGLPTFESSPGVFEAMAEAGADGFEVGIPYADPLMDGPVIAEAAARALEAGITVRRSFEIAERVATSTGKPVILMTYTNPVLHYGAERFASDAASAGASGLIIADLPAEEADPYLAASRAAGLGMALFAAPTTTDARLDVIADADPAFVYGVASLGVTGERTEMSEAIADLSTRIRSRSSVPIVAGVGISTPEQAAAAARHVDGVIVGSAIVRRVLEASSPEAAATSIAEAVTDLAEAVRRSSVH